MTAEAGRPPGLAVVLVGDRPDSQIYVHRKQEACRKVRRRRPCSPKSCAGLPCGFMAAGGPCSGRLHFS